MDLEILDISTHSRISHTTIATKTKFRKFVNSSLLGENYISHHKQEKENEYVDYKLKKLILNPYFSPLMASDEDLSRLPNTYITVSESLSYRMKA